ncbi:MAG TPA: ABC transporter permease subunit [Candidatus Binatia bacterium]|jgi:hypothetical protein|nr:ABC transporter permease subunit [Candidatus Binatia bacterium]
MTVLPIVERELRVAARRRGTYWVRLAIAFVGMGLGAIIFVITLGLPSAQTGRNIFEGLAALLLLYCLAYGRRSTADCLSQERREGTLGLLFLTDLKGHDVVLGKLVATSLNGFYGLLAVFPVLAIPLLMGGITNGELWRMVLVLVNTFVFSLAIGMLGSALTRDFRHAMAANFLLLLVFLAVPPACMMVQGLLTSFSQPPAVEWLIPCPAYAFYLCAEAQYKIAPAQFWISAGVTHGLAWLLVLLASRIVPRSWQDQPTPAGKGRWRERWRTWSYGRVATQGRFRRRLLDVNAFYWLAARAQRKPVHVWTFLGCMGVWWLLGWITSGRLWLDSSVAVLTAFLLNSTIKVWLAIEAGRQLADDQKSGAFELLLSVPLTVRDILRGQLLALRRQFLKPLLLVLGLEVLLLWIWMRPEGSQAMMTWLAGMAMLLADVAALIWVGMSRALIARSHNSATISTLLRVLALPWTVFGGVMVFGHAWFGIALGKVWTPTWEFQLGLWFGLGLAADLGFGWVAWWQLRHRFRELALRRFNPKPGRLAGWFSKAVEQPNRAKRREGAVFHMLRDLVRRRAFLAFAAVLLAACGAGIFFLRPRSQLPPPVVVTLNQSNGPVRVFPGSGGAFFILPNGSLWRWGVAGTTQEGRAPVPAQVGTNQDWVQAVAVHTHAVGLRRDGTLWEWGAQNRKLSAEPEQADPGHDWSDIAASRNHSVALRRDGTLWAWGDNSANQLGVGLNAPSAVGGAGFTLTFTTNLVQVGTNNDWAAVSCAWAGTVGLKKDGTLWAWGQLYVFGMSPGSIRRVTMPSRVCQESNWAEFTAGLAPMVRTRSGELWEAFYGVPDEEAPVETVARLVLTNAAPGRFATAYCTEPTIYELRADGTLWGKIFRAGGWRAGPVPAEPWRQVGKRSDWVSLWGGGGTAFGLTSDGTLWMWGVDPSRESAPDAASKLKVIQGQVQSLLGTPGPRFGQLAGPTIQKQPRPLLRMVSTNSPASAF